jgi:hypothetical protein
MDFKNVQRRVYDAINVLCALGVVAKNKNRIIFLGMPEETNKSDFNKRKCKHEEKSLMDCEMKKVRNSKLPEEKGKKTSQNLDSNNK